MNTIEATASPAVSVRTAGQDAQWNAGEIAAGFLAGYGRATREAYARDLKHWSRFLADNAVAALDARRVHVDAYCRLQEESGAAPATVARRLAAIHGFYAYAVDEGALSRSPVRGRRPRASQSSPHSGLGRDEIRALLHAAEASTVRDRALVTLLCLSGLRISEALAVDVEDLGYERGHRTLQVVRKGGRRQRLALAPHTAAALDELVGERVTGAVFQTSSGRRLDRHAAGKTVRRLARVAGIEARVSPHTLRHGFVTAALDAGVPLRDVQDAAGHADPRTTRRYDRNRHSLDRAATYAVASYLAA